MKRDTDQMQPVAVASFHDPLIYCRLNSFNLGRKYNAILTKDLGNIYLVP